MVLTIGHSTRPVEQLIEMLHANGLHLLVDVRTVPRSRYNPQYNTDALAQSLTAAGIAYRHMPSLGGLRHARKDSRNTGWRNASFRGYADYMQTEEFSRSLEELIRLSAEQQIVTMCAEAVPWRCHRSMIADALTARGLKVEHILSATRRDPHEMTAFARVDGTSITYPGPPEQQMLLPEA